MYAIAIDGPSSSGKTSIASEVAKKLNILHLNTGALYRAIGLFAYENGLANKRDKKGLLRSCKREIGKMQKNVKVDVEFKDGKQHTLLNGVDVTEKLHNPMISDYSSRVSAIPEIRTLVSEVQRNVADKHNIVMEGRDITSHVLPNAKYKFFITADPEIRAKRRMDELKSKGIDCTFQQVLEDIKERDYRDTTREICPLVQVKDAVCFDTTNSTIEQIVAKLLSYIKE